MNLRQIRRRVRLRTLQSPKSLIKTCWRLSTPRIVVGELAKAEQDLKQLRILFGCEDGPCLDPVGNDLIRTQQAIVDFLVRRIHKLKGEDMTLP